MRIKQNVCSKLWTDTNIDFRRLNIRHCCKQVGYDITVEEIDKLGVDMFEKYDVNIANKKQMLFENTIPESCKLCRINGENAIRHSWNVWSDDYINQNRDNLLDADKMWYLEIDLGDQCDLACAYCGPWSSTTWKKEMRHEIKAATDHQIEWREKTMANVIKRLDQLDRDSAIMINFLGGEPTLMPETYQILDNILPILKTFNNPPNLIFTTNLNTKEALFDKFVNTIKATHGYVHWTIGVSVENTGRRAELVRWGLDWERFKRNLKKIQHHGKIAFTCTHNVLNLPYYVDFLDWVFEFMDTEYVDGGVEGWKITPNCVYDNVLDPAYLDPAHVDFDRIFESLEKNNADQLIVDHIESIKRRCGTKKLTSKFYVYYRNLFMRHPDYNEYFPFIKPTLEKLESELDLTQHNPKKDYEYIWKRQDNFSDITYDKDKI